MDRPVPDGAAIPSMLAGSDAHTAKVQFDLEVCFCCNVNVNHAMLVYWLHFPSRHGDASSNLCNV